MKQEIKQCQNCKNEFTIEPDDFTFYEKIDVPPPTFCPECRFQRRLLFRNEQNFYNRTCDLCRKQIVSTYSTDVVFPVYCQKCWWSDKWDPYKYGRDIDFSRPFFEQIKELWDAVPAISLMNDDTIASKNCEYTYDLAFGKNCYLVVCAWYLENTMYSYFTDYVKDVVDSTDVHNSELMYESLNSERCYECVYCQMCFDCHNCTFGYDLKNCSDCIMCVGLRNKKYCILNKQYTKAEYEKRAKELALYKRSSIEKHWKEFQSFVMKYPRKNALILKSVNTTGDFLFKCKESQHCFWFNDLQNCKFMFIGDTGTDSYDCNNTGKPILCYESVTPDESYGAIATIYCWKCRDVAYSNNCHSSEDIFGCTALKKGSYAILNKRYTKDEYVNLRDRLVAHMRKTGEWGEFFPYSLSSFAYNETAAQQYFPLTKEEALGQGYRWKEREKRNYNVTIKAKELPETIDEINDSILGEVIECIHKEECDENCMFAFKIIPQELAFYRKMKLPIPQLCSNCRYHQRFKRQSPLKLWHRKCQCEGTGSDNKVYTNTSKSHKPHKPNEHCPNEFETSYAPDREEIVYCEQCYQAEVV